MIWIVLYIILCYQTEVMKKIAAIIIVLKVIAGIKSLS